MHELMVYFINSFHLYHPLSLLVKIEKTDISFMPCTEDLISFYGLASALGFSFSIFCEMFLYAGTIARISTQKLASIKK
ncbi:hypothetical protein CTZ29_13760 [Bacillus halotolerans]|nr:hypothetical protein CTZ29_13760 [Bacillus halotolerans]